MRLRHYEGAVTGTLIDNNHAMWVRLEHSGGMVTSIDGGFDRWPTTGCLGAPDVLRELTGTPLTTPREELVAGGKARRHCTHLYDLALFALAMAARTAGERQWDAVVPDPVDGRTVATITLNGEVALRWPLEGQTIKIAGDEPQSLLSGFRPWATTRYAGDALEGAIILRMAAFTARARAHLTDNKPRPLSDFPERRGACHAYSPPQVDSAVHRLNVVRNFSAGLIEPKAGPRL